MADSLKKIILIIILFAILFLCYAIYFNTCGLRTACFLDTKIHDVTNIQQEQVIQRIRRGYPTPVYLKGRVGLLADKIEYVVAGEAEQSIAPSRWRIIDSLNIRYTFFEGYISVPEGWNYVYLRSRNGKAIRLFNPIKLGVGDLYIVAGQSNAAGDSKTLLKSLSGMVRNGQVQENRNISWKTGNDPQIRGGGGSVWPLVGDMLADTLRIPVGFINVAKGGTGINEWIPETSNFDLLLKTIKMSGNNRTIKAVLWHQGESDSLISENEYYEKLWLIIQTLNKQNNTKTKWIVACTSYNGHKTYTNLRNAQQRIWKNHAALKGPDTDKYLMEYREPPDYIHFNKKGTMLIARDWYEHILHAMNEEY